MQHLLSITLITIAVDRVYSQDDFEHQGPQTCGGRLRGPVGVIQTPDFPNPFPVPIKCKWIIEHDIPNGTISIYFTQQYTTSGLTFTEYMYYDESYKLGERRALTVTEENITRIKWLQDLKLLLKNSLEGKGLLNLDKTKPLDNAARQRLVRIIGTSILKDNPNQIIRTTVYANWTHEIVRVFPQEKPSVYFHSKIVESTRGLVTRLAGKLPDQIHNLKRKYRESGVLHKRQRLSRSASPSSSPSTSILRLPDDIIYEEDVSDDILWLKNSTDPWITVVNKWTLTTKSRLQSSKHLTIADYFREYPALQKPLGYILLEKDFEILYAGQFKEIYETFPIIKEKLFELGKKRVGSGFTITKDKNLETLVTLDQCNDVSANLNFVQSPVLVVELELNRLEGTQLRALGLLSVFGFNVTYAVRAPTDPPGPISCSAIECRLLGHCYARQDFQEFHCSCFEGYSGPDCGAGPLCPRTSNMCKNGGTCRQMGPAAVSCICAPGYTGDLCESQIASPECGIEECSESCKEGTTCDCNPKDTDASSARFETRLQVVNQPNINISQEVIKQITTYLKASNITLEDEIEILNVSSVEANGGRTVWLRVWGSRREAGSLRAALARLAATRSRADTLRLLPATLHFDMQPALSLHALIVNQRPEVWEGSEFILSCMAYGSPDITFTWYKDGVKVNFNGTTRDIWTRTVSEDALGRRMSVLGISEAKAPDGGKWSCAADDAGRRRCRALNLAVLKPPDIRLVPSTLTVNKGDNVSITCLAGAGRVHGILGFSWARERTLLPLAPGREVWEDLYPAGSVLKLYNVQRSGEFRCQVSSVAGTNAKGVIMWALGANDEACESEASHGLRWPKTAPGAHASASCPPGHNGETTRFCEPKTGQHGVKWMLPDFSGCVADSLKDIYEQFSKISYGYSWGNVSHVARQYSAVLPSLPSHPGEGTLPLYHSKEMLNYLLSSAGEPKDRLASAEHLLKIYDTLLKYPDAFLDEEKIYELQNAIIDTAGMKDNLDHRYHEFTVKTKPARDEGAHFDLQNSYIGTEEWSLASAGVELLAKNGNVSVVAVLYHNLASRLPSLRRSIEFNETSSRNGREMEYQIASQQIQLSASGPGVDKTLQHTVKLIFTHVKNYSAIASKLACGIRTPSEPRAWSTKACEVRVTEPTHVMCKCRGFGTFGLFTIARSTLTDAEKDLRGIVKITASLGAAMCLAAAALQLLAIVPARRARLPVLLKAATAGTHSAAMLALLECDTRQEEACPGALGWVCAACWCAGSAALCAQPLLLQAELAGRSQHAPSVGLLAGVCTLCWLSARVWGGAPLQLGGGAAALCAGGAALLAALCVALALSAAARLAHHHGKLPIDRRHYLADSYRVVRHSVVLAVTTCGAQAAGVAYAQPGERRLTHVAALSVAALANGLAMLICYVIRDEECLRSARRVLSLPSNKDWQDSPAGDTSLSLYIKQGGEVESRGGVLESSSSPVSPITSYWRAPGLESPARLNRRQSNPDSRADIVRCVEYKDSVLSPQRHEPRRLPTSHAVCDLIPHVPIQPEYMARVCLQLGVLNTDTRPPDTTQAPILTCSVDYEPYTEKRFDISKENCSICVQSNPDVSRIPSPPIKSCLKKSKSEYTSTSLPSIEVKEDKKSDMEQVNREWNKAYDSPETNRMLNKISNDLDFLLNRTQESSKILDQIKEAPT